MALTNGSAKGIGRLKQILQKSEKLFTSVRRWLNKHVCVGFFVWKNRVLNKNSLVAVDVVRSTKHKHGKNEICFA